MGELLPHERSRRERLNQVLLRHAFRTDASIRREAKEKHFMMKNLPQSEIGRFIKPAEIGRLTAFLCSPMASSFKGSPIRMDGGMVPTIF